MAWTAPMTAVTGAAFTAAQFNLNVRDNLLETAVAKATAAGRLFVSTGVNSIAEREVLSATVATSETTTSTSYTDLTTVGPAVTVVTGPRTLVLFGAAMTNSSADVADLMSIAVSGSTTVAASDAWALHLRGPASPATQRAGTFKLFTGLTPGANTFTAKYKVGSGTGTFIDRELAVLAL